MSDYDDGFDDGYAEGRAEGEVIGAERKRRAQSKRRTAMISDEIKDALRRGFAFHSYAGGTAVAIAERFDERLALMEAVVEAARYNPPNTAKNAAYQIVASEIRVERNKRIRSALNALDAVEAAEGEG